MYSVYEADHLIDAHLARGRLLAAGISARVRGESLTGAMGELPAIGLLQVCVDAADVDLALEVIAEWRHDLAGGVAADAADGSAARDTGAGELLA